MLATQLPLGIRAAASDPRASNYFSQEYLYREEFESYVREGVLAMHTAFSREQAACLQIVAQLKMALQHDLCLSAPAGTEDLCAAPNCGGRRVDQVGGLRVDCLRNKNCEMLALGAQAGQEVAELMLKQGGHFYVCGSARQVPEDIYTAMKEARPRVVIATY